MKRFNIISVQFYNCSENVQRKINSLFAKKTYYPAQTACLRRCTHLTRLSDRTLYPLWETGMQVCKRSWPWPQVLPVCQLPWAQAGARLCTPKVSQTGGRISDQLSESKTNLGGDLQHQPRALTTQRTVVKESNGYPWNPLYLYGYCSISNLSSQYASGLCSRSVKRNRFMGGEG